MRTLQELLQRRGEIEAELTTILDTCATEQRGRNEAEKTSYDGLRAELTEVENEIAEREAEEADRAELAQRAARRPEGTRSAALIIGERKTDPEVNGGFRSLGEFMGAVVRGDERALANVEYREQSTTVGSEGGFVIPTDFSKQILEVPGSTQIVRPRATVIPAGESPDAEIEIPALDQTGSGGMYGGVEVFWQDEESDSDVPDTDAKFRQVALKSKNVTGLMTVSNKLARNAAWATPIFTRLLSACTIGAEDYAMLSGDGIGKPLGIRNCTGVKWVNRGSANDVEYEDVLAMETAMHPDSISTAVYVASQSIRPLLQDMKDHAGNRVYLTRDFSKGQPDTLNGIPILYTGKIAAKGSKGDLLLVDFTYYLIKDGADLMVSASEHVMFKKNRTVVKVIRSVDGKGWVTGPMYLEDGITTVSPFVGLDVVAG